MADHVRNKFLDHESTDSIPLATTHSNLANWGQKDFARRSVTARHSPLRPMRPAPPNPTSSSRNAAAVTTSVATANTSPSTLTHTNPTASAPTFTPSRFLLNQLKVNTPEFVLGQARSGLEVIVDDLKKAHYKLFIAYIAFNSPWVANEAELNVLRDRKEIIHKAIADGMKEQAKLVNNDIPFLSHIIDVKAKAPNANLADIIIDILVGDPCAEGNSGVEVYDDRDITVEDENGAAN